MSQNFIQKKNTATGPCISGAAALTRATVVFSGKTIWITIRMGKGKKTQQVPVHERTAEVLKEFLETKADKDESPA